MFFVVFADDHSRVLLNPIEGLAGSDYINANFIDVSFSIRVHGTTIRGNFVEE